LICSRESKEVLASLCSPHEPKEKPLCISTPLCSQNEPKEEQLCSSTPLCSQNNPKEEEEQEPPHHSISPPPLKAEELGLTPICSSIYSLSEETFNHCVHESDLTTLMVVGMSDRSVSNGISFDNINLISAQMGAYCSEISRRTYEKCMETFAADPELAFPLYQIPLMRDFNIASEETLSECSRASDQIAAQVLPIYEEIIGLCERTVNNCTMDLMMQPPLKNDEMLKQLRLCQDDLAQSTTQSSLLVSDSILSKILAI
jgi:hypothetical protein